MVALVTIKRLQLDLVTKTIQEILELIAHALSSLECLILVLINLSIGSFLEAI